MKMLSVNLFPPEILIRRRHAALIRYAVIGAAILSVLVMGFLGLQRFRLMSLRAEQERMNEMIATNQEMATRIAAEKEKRKSLEVRAAILLNAMDSPRWGTILAELSTVVPADVWIQSLAFSPQARQPAAQKTVAVAGNARTASPEIEVHDYGEIRIQGGGAGAQSVSRFIEALSKNAHFDKVTPVVTETLGMGRPASYTLVGRLLF